MGTLVQDLKYALRTLVKSPGFTLAALAALALGIGTNTAVFSVVNAVMLRPIPVADADRIVLFVNTPAEGQGPAASPAKFQHYREQTSVVEDVSAFRTNVVNYTGGDLPEQLTAGQVSADFFRLVGAPILQGRTFAPDEDRPNGPRVAVLGHALWTRQFDADPSAVGQTISLSGEPYVVIGVLGPGLDVSEFAGDPDVWLPFQLDPGSSDQGHFFRAAGRLKDGVSLDQAQARLALSAEDYRRKFPNVLQENQAFGVTPVQEAFVANVRQNLLILLAAVSFVLLIACANVASLLLVRATARKREIGLMAYSVEQRTQEIGVRLALGAESRDVRRMIVFQGMRLAVLGVVFGVVSAWLLTRFLTSQLFGVEPRDPMVFTAIPVILVAVALVAVWVPAYRASLVSPLASLRSE